jgi:hypothetical protein
MAKRNFKPVDAGASIGSITFIRPSRLAEEKKTGVVLEGTFVESLPNQFDNNKLDYKFTDEKGGLIVLNGAGNLGFKMKNINAGDLCANFLQWKKRNCQRKDERNYGS